MHSATFKIADVIVKMQSRFFMMPIDFKEGANFRFKSFVYKGKKKPDIIIKIRIVKKLPQYANLKRIFTTYHFQNGDANWHFFKNGNSYIFKGTEQSKLQVYSIDKKFKRVDAYFLPKHHGFDTNKDID